MCSLEVGGGSRVIRSSFIPTGRRMVLRGGMRLIGMTSTFSRAGTPTRVGGTVTPGGMGCERFVGSRCCLGALGPANARRTGLGTCRTSGTGFRTGTRGRLCGKSTRSGSSTRHVIMRLGCANSKRSGGLGSVMASFFSGHVNETRSTRCPLVRGNFSSCSLIFRPISFCCSNIGRAGHCLSIAGSNITAMGRAPSPV